LYDLHQHGKAAVSNAIMEEVEKAVTLIEEMTAAPFWRQEYNPCLVSVRSGARVSMPG
jgi:pyruvate,orthophosphate dikinase